MVPGICPDWAILILTGQTELASEALCGNSATVLPGSCGRTLIIGEDLKGTQS